MKDKNKTKGNDPINPIDSDILISERNGNFDSVGSMNPFGLTKREYFAAIALQGLAANRYIVPIKLVKNAIEIADLLISKLNQDD
ncbi:hypothetical protein [Nubsella zeaxanthinifaciens]|uniref:hypothetical protein n=1 Tax=Nubsella zeaxanthinifaciens TaxID=392412 RepID=UPI000DE378CF|nr:hypothetical protein [Nubsella zeaxanthinifaciens]